MTQIPASHRDILDNASLASLGTVDADGTPQVTPVWIDYDGTHFLINSAKGRKKDRNLRERPEVAFAIIDKDNPYRYLGVQGKVVEVTEVGADALIDKLAKKYLGVDSYPYRNAAETRVTYKIEPTRVWMV